MTRNLIFVGICRGPKDEKAKKWIELFFKSGCKKETNLGRFLECPLFLDPLAEVSYTKSAALSCTFEFRVMPRITRLISDIA